MTTAAFDGKLFATDKQVTSNNHASDRFARKLYFYPDYGLVLTVAGNAPSFIEVVDWAVGEIATEQRFSVPDGDFTVLAVRVTPGLPNMIYTGFRGPDNQCGHMEREYEKRTAIGSGGQFALGAMAMKGSAVEAIEIAMDLDVYTGGGIDWFDTITMEHSADVIRRTLKTDWPTWVPPMSEPEAPESPEDEQ
ncbi:hypothetical protein [Vibrio phage vB_VpS_CA8]|uniref:Uncharacterized protein n=1 Tax=Vibrio phage PH669 TaxID=2800823 RepID=A0A7T7CL57_9CAUD|nr:hypothetical protein [Vibrio phage vB_VpS_CA8]QQK88579.1 hypothetical protein [Vibrio phage PH669]UFK26935.1 hypothetical protein [Vibrio phage vB_VpaS_AL-2]